MGVTSQGSGAHTQSVLAAAQPQESTGAGEDSQRDTGARAEPSPAPGFPHQAQVTAEGLTIFEVSLTALFFLLFFLPNQVFPLLINFDFQRVLSDYQPVFKNLSKLKQESSALLIQHLAFMAFENEKTKQTPDKTSAFFRQ